ncbi:hypothetical protein BCR44DRAFT_57755 [Catenaria anguillulae PL171]|uniref:Uncharacterized protein n=1 Tax=Catenaria anguillulae PL171 TaxID=765915 RepID=A0A1Y2HG63_9FUNG|nr:hypothetical protein BCR44DRAFT_57755 [Catenaria anguillulae PL171]
MDVDAAMPKAGSAHEWDTPAVVGPTASKKRKLGHGDKMCKSPTRAEVRNIQFIEAERDVCRSSPFVNILNVAYHKTASCTKLMAYDMIGHFIGATVQDLDDAKCDFGLLGECLGSRSAELLIDCLTLSLATLAECQGDTPRHPVHSLLDYLKRFNVWVCALVHHSAVFRACFADGQLPAVLERVAKNAVRVGQLVVTIRDGEEALPLQTALGMAEVCFC